MLRRRGVGMLATPARENEALEIIGA